VPRPVPFWRRWCCLEALDAATDKVGEDSIVGLLIVSVVVVTCMDDAVAKAPELIATNATALIHKTPLAIAVETKSRCERANENSDSCLKKKLHDFW